jgi:hypothetical protein
MRRARRLLGVTLLLSLAGCAAFLSDFQVIDDGGLAGDAGGNADGQQGQPDGASDVTLDTGSDSARHDTSVVDSGSTGARDSAVKDSGSGLDASGFDAYGADSNVIIPDVYVPPGTTTCNYNGSLFAQYVSECLIYKSGATLCSAGCSTSDCCGVLCQNSSNQHVCLPK